jgi:hypothetical protein
MAYNPGASFPTQTLPPTSAYPYGQAKNVSAPGAGDGTPWVAPLVNDWFGFFQSLLVGAGLTPTGDPDEVGDSQYFSAMVSLFDQSAAGTTGAPGLLQLSDDPTSTSTSRAATINAVRQVAASIAPAVAGDANNWSIKIGKIKIQGGRVSVNNTTTTVTFSGNQTAYTGAHVAFIPWIANAAASNDNPIYGGVVNSSSGSIRVREGTTLCGYITFGWDA